jgi:predicted MFS family arabinose efflux permease
LSGVFAVSVFAVGGFIGQRFGSLIPCLLLIIILLVTGVIIPNVTSPIIFFMAVPICGMIPMIMTPFYLGAMAKLDPTGGLAAAHPAFSTMGGAAGPVVMGYVSDWQGFTGIGWVVLITILMGIPLISIALMEADKK